ncbi:MAG TPA: phosphatase PAP2 family protein [Conexivisphaerales archaeon]|nr:phosphatase PAP2 family protein [Conexivisphaerales archaeon]
MPSSRAATGIASSLNLGEPASSAPSVTESLNPSFVIVGVLLSAFLYGMLFALRSPTFPFVQRRLFWMPSVFLVGALVVASASLGSSKFEVLRTNALEPAFSWMKKEASFLRKDSYILMLGAYVSLLLFSYFRFGILFQFSLGMYALMSLPVVMVIGRGRLVFLKSWIPFLIVFLSYEALQGVVSVIVANGGIISLYAIDAPLWGFNLTGAVQSALLSKEMTLAMTFFYTLHLPLVVLASIFFWYLDKSTYKRYTYAIILTSYCALVTFLFFPTAPPWYEGAAANLLQGVNSVVPVQVYSNLMNAIESDKFAAFPSLHSAFAIIFLYYMSRRGRKYTMLALPITAGILLSTVYLGQHYVIDIIGGAAYSLSACLLVDWVIRRSERRAAGGGSISDGVPSAS